MKAIEKSENDIKQLNIFAKPSILIYFSWVAYLYANPKRD